MAFCYRSTIITVGITTALMLSACQPSTEETSAADNAMPPPIEASETIIEPEVRASDNIMEDKALSDAEVINSDMLREYNRAISRMVDEMMIGMNYNDPDTAFTKIMLGQHRGSLEMAKIELKYGTDVDMRKFAQDLIDSQQIKSDTLNKRLANYPDTVNPTHHTQTMQQAYARTIEAMYDDMMIGIADPNVDVAFARAILAHHSGVVDLAKIELKHGEDQAVVKLAQRIIDDQQPKTSWLQQWIALHDADNNMTESTEETVTAEESVEEPAL